MHRKFWKSAMATAVVAGMAILGSASPARAVPVTYTTAGFFLGGDTPNTSVYTAPGVRIVYEGVTSNTVDAPSFAGFGTFNTVETTATTPTTISGGFRLDIFQVAPAFGGPAEFLGSLNGQLDNDSSTAFVRFTDLEKTITVGGFSTTYRILEADSDTDGTSISGRSNLNPPTTNLGRSTVEGFIRTTGTPPPPTAIPEPSTLLMGAMAAPAVLICLRRKGKVKV